MFSFLCTMWVHIKQPKARAPYSLFSSYAAFFTTRSAKINSGSGLFVGAFFGSGGRCFPVHFCGGGMLLLVRCCGRAFLILALGGGGGSRYEKTYRNLFPLLPGKGGEVLSFVYTSEFGLGLSYHPRAPNLKYIQSLHEWLVVGEIHTLIRNWCLPTIPHATLSERTVCAGIVPLCTVEYRSFLFFK